MCEATAIMAFSSMIGASQASKAKREQRQAIEDQKKKADLASIKTAKQRKTKTGGKEQRKTGRGILNVSAPSSAGSSGY